MINQDATQEECLYMCQTDCMHMLSLLRLLRMPASFGSKLKCVVQDCPEVYFCICCMPAKNPFNKSTLKSPYERLQDDILQLQGRRADILVCGDMNAWTAGHDDCIRLSEPPQVPDEADDLPDPMQPRHNCE